MIRDQWQVPPEVADPTEVDFRVMPPANDSSPGSAWLVLALLLATAGPLFVCLPLTNDTEVYDLQAWIFLRGGTLYADVFEPNFPGIIWLHALVRSVVGWSSEALRLFDLAMLGVLIGLVWTSCRLAKLERRPVAWLAVLLCFAYLSQSEWVQTQRDMWLLVPLTAAICLRQLQIQRVRESAAGRKLVLAGFVEGLVWGAGIWLKPYIVVPAALVWLVSALRMGQPRSIARDVVGLLAGGLVAGGLGLAGLAASGAWAPFWDVVSNWAPYYWEARLDHWTRGRFIAMVYRLSPWIFVVPAAGLLAMSGIRRAVAATLGGTDIETDDAGIATGSADRRTDLFGLWSAAFLGWTVQVYGCQHLFDYVHWPLVWLALVLAGLSAAIDPRGWKKVVVYAFLLLAIVFSPCIDLDRLAVWPRCFTEGSSPEVRNRLALIPTPNWVDLAAAEAFLREQHVANGDVDTINNSLVALYRDLDIAPAHRFVFQESVLMILKPLRREIWGEILGGPQRYAVTDLAAVGLMPPRHDSRTERGQTPLSLPPGLEKRYPWNLPVVFQAGTIVVRERPPESRTASTSSDVPGPARSREDALPN